MEFNFCDLAFFNSLQSDVVTHDKTTKKDLIKVVKRCFADYEAERMDGCCRSLITAYVGNLETGGDNNYKMHRGVRKATSRGIFDLSVAKSVFDKAAAKLEQLKEEAKAPPKAPNRAESESEVSDGSEESSGAD